MTTELKSKCCEATVFAAIGKTKTLSDTTPYWICEKCNKECDVQEELIPPELKSKCCDAAMTLATVGWGVDYNVCSKCQHKYVVEKAKLVKETMIAIDRSIKELQRKYYELSRLL